MKKFFAFSVFAYLLLTCSSAFARDLKPGVVGEDVRKWQMFLIARNFDLPVNGKFGPATTRATIIFQKKWNLYADGVVGPRTMEKAKALGYDRIVALGSRNNSPNRVQSRVVRFTARQIGRIIGVYLQNTLHDPDSLKDVSSSGFTTSTTEAWTYAARIQFRAKNRFGAYVLNDKIFFLNENGEVMTSTDAD